ncbi:MAG: presenilin-like A22 family membrane protease, partial [Natronomonas sp.]
MDHRQRQILASAAILGIFFVVQLGALALVEPFLEGGLQGSQDTSNPGISIAYIVGILAATVVMLGVIKYGGQNVLRLVIIFAGVYITFFVFDALVPALGTVGGVAV